jgi:hypothetical protein
MQPSRPGSSRSPGRTLSRAAAVLVSAAAFAAVPVAPVAAGDTPAALSAPVTGAPSRVAAAASPAVERIALAAPAGLRVSGKATAAAGSVAGAVVTACPSPAPATTVPVACKGGLTTAAGTWTITGLAPGRYIVRVAPPASAGSAAAAGYVGAAGYVAARGAAQALDVTNDRTGVDLALPAGRIVSGSVVADGGRAVRDAFVEACAADAPAGVACTGAYTGADGTFSIGGLGAGAYIVGVQAPTGSGLASGYVTASGISPATASARRVDAGSAALTIALPQGRSARGAVALEKAGAAAPGQVLVQACADAACVYGPAAWTDEDGRFEIPGLGTGTYVISFSLPSTPTHVSGYRGEGGFTPSRGTAARIAVAGADVGGLDVTLPLAVARIEGAATGGGTPLRGGVVVACGAAGTCVWTRTLQRDGTYALGLPSAGPWTVAVRAPGTYTVGLPLAWTAGMVVPVDPVAMDGYVGGGGFTPDAARAAAVTVGAPDRTRPTITARAPKPDATKVATSTRVVVRFSEPVTGVSAKSIVLRDAVTRKAVAATVTYDAAGRTATLRPRAALAKGRRYQVLVAGTIADDAGNRLAPATWTFTTRR